MNEAYMNILFMVVCTCITVVFVIYTLMAIYFCSAELIPRIIEEIPDILKKLSRYEDVPHITINPDHTTSYKVDRVLKSDLRKG